MALEILNGDCVFFINHEWNATTSLPPTHSIDPQHWGALLVLNTQLWWLTWDFPAMFSHVFQSVHVQLASTDINLHYVFISLCFQAYQWGIGLLNGPFYDQTSKCSLFLLLIWCYVLRSRSEPSINEDCDGEGRSAVALSIISTDSYDLTVQLSVSHRFVFACRGRGVLSPVQGQGSVLNYSQQSISSWLCSLITPEVSFMFLYFSLLRSKPLWKKVLLPHPLFHFSNKLYFQLLFAFLALSWCPLISVYTSANLSLAECALCCL